MSKPYEKEYNYLKNNIRKDYYSHGTSFNYHLTFENHDNIFYQFFNSHEAHIPNHVVIQLFNKRVCFEYYKHDIVDKYKFKKQVLEKFIHYFARKLWEYKLLDDKIS